MEPEKIDQYLKKRIIGEASESKCPEELLDKQSLTTAFEELVGTRGQEETKYYAKQWKEKRKHDKTLTWSDYIYYYVLCFEHNSDVAKEYLKLKASKEKNKKTMLDNQEKLQEKLRDIGENKKLKKGKRKIEDFKTQNEKELSELEEKDTQFLMETAWKNCSIPDWLGFLKFNFPIAWSWNAENAIDREKNYILLYEFPVMECEKMRALKNEDEDNFIEAIKNNIIKYHIPENMLKITRENVYLNNRLEIISTSIELFQKGKYKAFVFLAMSQIEGLLKTLFQFVWGDKSENDGLKSIADKIREKDDFGKYIYLAYELPELRNHIAHGDMIEIDTKLACEILMVLNRLIKEIDSEEQDYKKIMAFLNDVSTADLKTLASRLNYYFSSINNVEYCGLFERYLKGEFDDVIQWYQLSDKDCEFKKIIQSDEFYLSIWNKDPMFTTTVEKVQLLDGSVKDIPVKHYSESLQYEGMVQLLYRLLNEKGKSHKYKPVPLNWYEEYNAFVKQANEAKHDTLKKVGIDPDAIEAEVDKLMEKEPND